MHLTIKPRHLGHSLSTHRGCLQKGYTLKRFTSQIISHLTLAGLYKDLCLIFEKLTNYFQHATNMLNGVDDKQRCFFVLLNNKELSK